MLTHSFISVFGEVISLKLNDPKESPTQHPMQHLQATQRVSNHRKPSILRAHQDVLIIRSERQGPNRPMSNPHLMQWLQRVRVPHTHHPLPSPRQEELPVLRRRHGGQPLLPMLHSCQGKAIQRKGSKATIHPGMKNQSTGFRAEVKEVDGVLGWVGESSDVLPLAETVDDHAAVLRAGGTEV